MHRRLARLRRIGASARIALALVALTLLSASALQRLSYLYCPATGRVMIECCCTQLAQNDPLRAHDRIVQPCCCDDLQFDSLPSSDVGAPELVAIPVRGEVIAIATPARARPETPRLTRVGWSRDGPRLHRLCGRYLL